MPVTIFTTLKSYYRQSRTYSDIEVNGQRVTLAQYAIAYLNQDCREIDREIARHFPSNQRDRLVKLSNVLRHNFTDYDRQLSESYNPSDNLKNIANVRATHAFMEKIIRYYKGLQESYDRLGRTQQATISRLQTERKEHQEEILDRERQLAALRDEIDSTRKQAEVLALALNDKESELKQAVKDIKKLKQQKAGLNGWNNRYRQVTQNLELLTGISFMSFERLCKPINEVKSPDEKSPHVRELQETILKFQIEKLGLERTRQLLDELES